MTDMMPVDAHQTPGALPISHASLSSPPDNSLSSSLSSELDSPGLLVRGGSGLAVLGTTVAVIDHLGLSSPAVGFADLGSVSLLAWMWAMIHVVGALGSLAVGHRLLTWAYPLAHLSTLGATNPAAAIQLTAHRLAAAAIAGACWGGWDRDSALIAVVFTVVAWVALALICAGHRLVTRFRDHEEIAAGNLAAALASAGLHLAVALVTVRALQGQFLGWWPSLAAFAFALVWVVALYPLRQLIVARLILRMTPQAMDRAVSVQRAVWIGAVEGLGYLLTALAVATAW